MKHNPIPDSDEIVIRAPFDFAVTVSEVGEKEPEFEIQGRVPSKYYFIFKQVTDTAGALFLTVGLLSWILPLIALLIKSDSRGPVFFVQWRIGKHGKIFRCFKFRSMVINAQADKQQAVPDDSRITRVGRFLRHTNIDEIPQVINVLLGDMSFVGPRPHMISDHQLFRSVVSEYKFRNLVKPGITGLAQVKGFSGPATERDSIVGRFYWDAWYIKHAGLWLDIRILLRTLLLFLS